MFKRLLLIGLFVMGLVGMFRTEANADCIDIGGDLFCADWITGSGMPTGIMKRQGAGATAAEALACPTVETFQGGIDPPTTLTLRLVGTVGTNCGLGLGQNSDCDIRGVALCGNSTNNNAITSGPLLVESPFGFAQPDPARPGFPSDSSVSANYRFQLSSFGKNQVCPGDTFKAFFAREGFFEACVTNGTTTNCIRQSCTVNLGGVQSDRPRVYNCRPL